MLYRRVPPSAGTINQGKIMAIDVVCHVHVDEQAAEITRQYITHYDGRNFYFCSEECQKQFEQQPEEYARKTA
jgi:YHS domain-containing protein